MTAQETRTPQVSVIMGSQSDWRVMKPACETLVIFGIAHETLIVSAHRTPERMADFASQASQRGIRIIIAGAGGAAHLPGMVAAMTTLPVLGVPVRSRIMAGVESLLSIVEMPDGVPVGTVGINKAKNAALLAVSILALSDKRLAAQYKEFRQRQTQSVAEHPEN